MGASSGRLLLSHMPAAAAAAVLLLLVFAAAPAARASRSPSEKQALESSLLAVEAFNRRQLSLAQLSYRVYRPRLIEVAVEGDTSFFHVEFDGSLILDSMVLRVTVQATVRLSIRPVRGLSLPWIVSLEFTDIHY